MLSLASPGPLWQVVAVHAHVAAFLHVVELLAVGVRHLAHTFRTQVASWNAFLAS